MERDQDVVHWFVDEVGEYRWHRVAPNHKLISTSGEGYENKDDCIEMAEALNPGIEIKPEPSKD